MVAKKLFENVPSKDVVASSFHIWLQEKAFRVCLHYLYESIKFLLSDSIEFPFLNSRFRQLFGFFFCGISLQDWRLCKFCLDSFLID